MAKLFQVKKEIQEVKNAYAAYEKINENDMYNINDFKSLHGIMMKYLIDEAGVFDGYKCIFMAPPTKKDNLFLYIIQKIIP